MAALSDNAEKLYGVIGCQRSLEASNLQASKSLATDLSTQIGELGQTLLRFTETQRRDGIKVRRSERPSHPPVRPLVYP